MASEARRADGRSGAESRGSTNPVRRFLQILGPGFITGASDDDPSGIGTYAVAGASVGFAALWTALVTFPLMAGVQYICARVGLVSGMGLAGVLKRHYPRWLLYPAVVALLIANTINVGADIGAIAAAINMLTPIPTLWLILPVTGIILAVQIFGSYRMIERIFKWLTLALLTYIGAALFAHPPAGEVLRATFLPTIRPDARFLAMLVAILGTTISPYLFFWQASQEVEEEISQGRKRLLERQGATDQELTDAAWDVDIGMLFSNVVMYFIILATAATLHKAGQTNIQSATDAAQALRPLAGNLCTMLLGLGLVGGGFLAVPVLSGSAAYAMCEAFNWRCGLDENVRRAQHFYLIIAVATVTGMLMNFLRINPIAALFWTAVINGFLAPPLLVLIMLIANNRRIMGERVNGAWLNLLGWATTAAMFTAAVALVLTWGRS